MPLDDLTQEMIVVIDSLEKSKLYTASEAAATKYDPKLYQQEYRRLSRKIWRVVNERTESNDLGSWPDNCQCWDNGFPKHTGGEKAKIILLPGEKAPRWQGNTLLSALNDKECQFLHIHRLTSLLSDLAWRRIDEIDESNEANEIEVHGRENAEEGDDNAEAQHENTRQAQDSQAFLALNTNTDSNLVGFTLSIQLDDGRLHSADGFLKRGTSLVSERWTSEENQKGHGAPLNISFFSMGMKLVSTSFLVCFILLCALNISQKKRVALFKECRNSQLELGLEAFADYIMQQPAMQVTYNPSRLSAQERLALQQQREQKKPLEDRGKEFLVLHKSTPHLPILNQFTYFTMAPGS